MGCVGVCFFLLVVAWWRWRWRLGHVHFGAGRRFVGRLRPGCWAIGRRVAALSGVAVSLLGVGFAAARTRRRAVLLRASGVRGRIVRRAWRAIRPDCAQPVAQPFELPRACLVGKAQLLSPATRSWASCTSHSHTWLFAKLWNGRLDRPQSLAWRMRSSTRAWPRWSRSAGMFSPGWSQRNTAGGSRHGRRRTAGRPP